MWRKEPPTVEDVRQHQYWWNKSADGQPSVLDFDLDLCSELKCPPVVVCEGERFNPSDWGEYWAPCIPPN